ncbi:conjugal transfer protein TraF [Escherichia coli]|uniref:conjugal transfer protein TraF n=2 Tax=Escherichia coli TaxID=562 RepID=UPI00292C7C30|nr:conjugal transfer protein TraF [Escherichia coli]MDV2041187.1 conjugal transfer protein TraF [Escherichia coli]
MNKALLPLLLCCFIFPASGKDAGWQWYNEKINPKEKENKPVPAAPRQEPDIMQKLAEHYGIMFFYRGQDPIDGQLAQVINGFRDTYGLSVIPVSVDGVINPLLPDSRTDQGQAQRLGVKYFPAMMLVDPKQGSVRPLSYGFISQDDLAKQFLNVSEDFKPNF